MALSVIGEGEVWHNGVATPTSEVLREKGMIGVELGAKDGLSLINGTSQMCSLLVRADNVLANLIPMADLIACVSLEAKECSIQPMDPRVHNVRPHHGQSLVAERISYIIEKFSNS